MKEIPLPRGKFTIVDDEDYELLIRSKWYISRGYVRRSTVVDGKRIHQTMHRLIINSPLHMSVDHINHNKLDNRKVNLRLCTNSQNLANSCIRKDNKTGYKGVRFIDGKNKFRAFIKCQGEKIYIGSYDLAEDAALAYNNKASELFGEFAYTGKNENTP